MKFPPVILASKSPRRQELLKLLGIDFRVILRDVDESFPRGLTPAEVAVYIAEKKAHAFDDALTENEVVITADTIVCIDDKILGKPESAEEAFNVLSLLSGRKHEVITGVALLRNGKLSSFYETTEVYFLSLAPEEISYYIDTCKPFDKAGSYGIQEWIGLMGIEKIVGSYSNVVGLPTHRVYQELLKLSE
ncbi:Maf family nucleotide pyrophosphatase [Pedobacter sp. SYSU D00535]|uniref:Maf family nucleotide pyrophosphatase n=1 Tax=Pedobacter sp. SYSU D00535 TaxID=2810308 RepID=UPI001A957D7D|nr:Maf family nucleotide pyrophosphatase [Pedobacter sp. SYSU D00535]